MMSAKFGHVDSAILVVDACDGVKPHTKVSLAINHKELSFLVASEAQPDRMRRELVQLGVRGDEVKVPLLEMWFRCVGGARTNKF